MKKIILTVSLILLTSCGLTQKELKEKSEICEQFGQQGRVREGLFGELNMICERKTDKVTKCIQEYTRGLDEKYNNPDTVINLREDKYSKVVETCNKIFGEK